MVHTKKSKKLVKSFSNFMIIQVLHKNKTSEKKIIEEHKLYRQRNAFECTMNAVSNNPELQFLDFTIQQFNHIDNIINKQYHTYNSAPSPN